MVKTFPNGVFYVNNAEIVDEKDYELSGKYGKIDKDSAKKNTVSYKILKAHNTSGNMNELKLRFDALASHDITYVNIIQTAKASGLTEFPVPYVLTNCHNSLCAVGGTINEDDHIFGLSAAQKYGGIYVPAHLAVIHQYMREMMAGGGKMILGSDSHTRYGALGTLAIGEGGGELAKQILCKTYDIDMPEIVGVYLDNAPRPGVGPQDIALAIIKAVFKNGYVKNKIMEFVGNGIANLNVEYRNGIDVMTTETTCLSSVWVTDSKVRDYLAVHGRADDFEQLSPPVDGTAYYDGFIYVDMAQVKPMIAMPCHPSNVYTIDELLENPADILRETEKTIHEHLSNRDVKFTLTDKVVDGKLYVDQGVVAGCAGGTYDNICECANILDGESVGSGRFTLSVYPSSQPTYLSLVENGSISKLMASGAIVRSAFCGPCFGAGDVPANSAFSIRHTTRNFPNREGSKPASGQMAAVALMDARSIAATAANKGVLTPATELCCDKPEYTFDKRVYSNKVYNGYKKADSGTQLITGPNITDWPAISAMQEHMLLNVASVIKDPVTTTDELIPSGETSSYRSNPLGLAEFTLSRKDPLYLNRAKNIQKAEYARQSGSIAGLEAIFETINGICGNAVAENTAIGSVIYAIKPGDGSAREQAASCQRVLGGMANLAAEYATKRYRSNLINWGIVPFLYKGEAPSTGDYIFVPNIRTAIADSQRYITAYILNPTPSEITLEISELTGDEKQILLAGCLINFYK